MYENFKWNLKTIIPMILLMIFAFIILPWLLSLGDTQSSQERNRFDDSSITYP